VHRADEFETRVISGELPVNKPINRVVMVLPRSDLRSKGHCVIDAPIKTLTFEDANRNFGHIQPAASLRSVVELESVQDTLSLAPVGRSRGKQPVCAY